MKSEKVSYYNFHDIITVRISCEKTSAFDSYLNRIFAHYATGHIERPQLCIDIGRFKPDTSGCVLLDEHFHVREDYIYYRNRYKYAWWDVQIKGIESGLMNVRMQGNPVSRMVIPGETIYSLIRYKLGIEGYPLLHGSGVGKNGAGYVFSARGGTGKTITAINAVKKGLDFYSDDSVILGKGKLFSFIVPFNLRFTYDVEKMLGIRFHPSLKFELFWKKALYYASLKTVSLFTNFDAKDAFKEAIKDSCRIAKVFILTQGEKFSIRRGLPREEAARKLFLNVWFESPELIGLNYAYNFVFPRSSTAFFWENMSDRIFESIKDTAVAEVILPRQYTNEVFERFYHEELAA